MNKIATVKYAALSPKDYGHGPRINVVCLCDGEEVKLWGKPNSPLSSLKRGEQVQITPAKNGYKLVSNETTPEAKPSDRGSFAKRIGEAVANYELAWNAATALLKRRTGQNLDPQLIEKVASELFRSTI